jgi:cobalt-zinc-cadmium efflux system protein
MFVEVAAGVLSGSLALLADAGHMLADAGALALALLAQVVADRPRTERSTYGFRRAEVLAAFVNGIALAVVSILVFKEALARWFEPAEIHGSMMLVTAILGLVVNVVVALILMGGRRDNVNVRAAFAHVVSDALGSVAAIAAGVLVFYFDWIRADPALSVGIAVLVFVSGYRILRETTDVLLESAPRDLSVEVIERTISGCPGVRGVHDLHIWRISQGFDTLTAHVVLEAGHHGVEVCRVVAERLRSEHGLTHVTIQPEAAAPHDTVPVRRGAGGEPLGAPGARKTALRR